MNSISNNFGQFRGFTAQSKMACAGGLATAIAGLAACYFQSLQESDRKGETFAVLAESTLKLAKEPCKVNRRDWRQAVKQVCSTHRSMVAEIDWIGRTAMDISPLVDQKIRSRELNWQECVQRAKRSITPVTSKLAYYQIVRELLSEIRDVHVHAEFTEKTPPDQRYIPLTFYTLNERLYVKNALQVSTDGNLSIRGEGSPLSSIEPHDEIIAIDELPAMQYLRAHAKALTGDNSLASLQRAAHCLFLRSSDHGIPVPEGSVKMEFISNGDLSRRVLELKWTDGKPEILDITWVGDQVLARLPILGDIISLDHKDHTVVVEFQFDEAQRVAYLLFDAFELDSVYELDSWLVQLEQSAALVVLDLRNNGGGRGSAMENILTGVIPAPIARYSQTNLLEQYSAKRSQETIARLSETLLNLKHENHSKWDFEEFLQTFSEEITDEVEYLIDWNRGERFGPMRMPHRRIYPSSVVRFTKPLIVLVNEGSASCSQRLAAILQDHGRALIFGTPTAEGAGGTNYSFNGKRPLQGPYAISSLKLPLSVTHRFPHQDCDNLQVIPDVLSPLTYGDTTGEKPIYDEKLQKVIGKMLADNSIAEIKESLSQKC